MHAARRSSSATIVALFSFASWISFAINPFTDSFRISSLARCRARVTVTGDGRSRDSDERTSRSRRELGVRHFRDESSGRRDATKVEVEGKGLGDPPLFLFRPITPPPLDTRHPAAVRGMRETVGAHPTRSC
ncbi:hypothetical protein EXIGLDRAFT_172923 [Exidia glandulosa HHB12029]|uniref:Uncharacterized protein n=1 Tax=Exidia glandulosa HHB12029 TaxID=1314781 RepID=A0A165F9J7_EXIGL|nr:hypothetical protein EXIGLDRAFT_172923 [Exidia glandulosa HHB12029]